MHVQLSILSKEALFKAVVDCIPRLILCLRFLIQDHIFFFHAYTTENLIKAIVAYDSEINSLPQVPGSRPDPITSDVQLLLCTISQKEQWPMIHLSPSMAS
jgi:hypothetical protein